MPDYTVTFKGITYDVDNAADLEEATKEAEKQYNAELSEKAKAEFTEAPTWAKPFMAAQDVGRTLADTFTLGGVDKFADYMSPPKEGQPSQADITRAVRSRMGGADIGADVAASVAQPSAVPGLVARVGGAPLVRKAVGVGAAGLEGAAYGAGSAIGHDQNATEGGITGAIGGMLGRTVADTLAYPVNKAAKWWTGANDALPPAVKAKAVSGKSSPSKQVEHAAARAELRGGRTGDIKKEFQKVRERGMTRFTPEEQAGVIRILEGDPGTKMARAGASLAAAGPMALGLGAGAMHSPMLAGALATGVPAAGMLASRLSRQGTQQSVDDLRRLMLGVPAYPGILTSKGKKRITGGVRGYYESDEE